MSESQITSAHANELLTFLSGVKLSKGDRAKAEKLLSKIHADRQRTPRQRKLLAAAKAAAVEGEIEVDDNALISEGEDPGAYVQAWMWVSLDEDEEQTS